MAVVKAFSMSAFKKNKLILEKLENRIRTTGAVMSGVNADYKNYILDGYSLYDVPAKGGLSYLDGETPGKYLTVWQSCAPAGLDTPIYAENHTSASEKAFIDVYQNAGGTIDLSDVTAGMICKCNGGANPDEYNIIKTIDWDSGVGDYGAWLITLYIDYTNVIDATDTFYLGGYDKIENSDISPHTDVIITGLRINSVGEMTGHTQEIRVEESIGRFHYCWAELYLKRSSTGYFADIENCITHFPDGYACDSEGGEVNNSVLYIYNSNVYNNETDMNNVRVVSLGTGFFGVANASAISLQNVIFDGFNSVDDQLDITLQSSTGNVYSNLLFKNCKIKFQSFMSIIFEAYFDNSEITSNSSSGTYDIIPVKEPGFFDLQKFNFGVPVIDDDLVDAADFYLMMAEFEASYINDESKPYDPDRRTNYSARFIESGVLPHVPDEIKKFSQAYIFYVERPDFEGTLMPSSVGKDIKDLTIYNHGTTTEFDFDSQENFLIKAEDSDGNVTYFLWMGGRLYQTVFADVWDGVTYQITECFQLWQISSANGLLEINRPVYDASLESDAPLSGSLTFNNFDSEVRKR